LKLRPKNNLEGVLLNFQKDWLKDDSSVKVWEKSRRIGATWVEALSAVLIAGRRKNPKDYWYTTINEDLSKEFIREAAKWAEHLNVAVLEMGEELFSTAEKPIRVQKILFASGKKITGVPAKPSVLRGRDGVLCCDEFAFIENPQELLKAGMAFLQWKGRIRILSTHNGEDSYFNQLVKDVRAERQNYSLHRTTLDDAISDGLYQRVCIRAGEEYSLEGEQKWRDELIASYREGADEELFCIPTNSSGSYFSRILIENAMIENISVFNLTLKDEFFLLQEEDKKKHVLDWATSSLTQQIRKLSRNYKTSFGFDFGRSGDLSYLIVFQQLPNLVRKAAFALELRNVPFSQQEQILFWIIDRLPRFIGGAMDSRGNGQSLAERTASKYGRKYIHEVPLSIPWYRENMPKYKAGLEDKKVLLPADSNLLDDHRLVESIDGVPRLPKKKNKGTDGKSRHGDGAIACALAYYASLHSPENCMVIHGSRFGSIWQAA